MTSIKSSSFQLRRSELNNPPRQTDGVTAGDSLYSRHASHQLSLATVFPRQILLSHRNLLTVPAGDLCIWMLVRIHQFLTGQSIMSRFIFVYHTSINLRGSFQLESIRVSSLGLKNDLYTRRQLCNVQRGIYVALLK